jgi:hypothetical protein
MAAWRTRLALIALGLIIGLGLGAVVGKVVWPVRYYNTDLADLTDQSQETYIQMVSDQWQFTHDVVRARAALSLLGTPDIGARMEEIAETLEAAGNESQAARVRALMEALP